MTVGILLPELGEGYHSQVISGAGELLMRVGEMLYCRTASLKQRRQ